LILEQLNIIKRRMIKESEMKIKNVIFENKQYFETNRK